MEETGSLLQVTVLWESIKNCLVRTLLPLLSENVSCNVFLSLFWKATNFPCWENKWEREKWLNQLGEGGGSPLRTTLVMGNSALKLHWLTYFQTPQKKAACEILTVLEFSLMVTEHYSLLQVANTGYAEGRVCSAQIHCGQWASFLNSQPRVKSPLLPKRTLFFQPWLKNSNIKLTIWSKNESPAIVIIKGTMCPRAHLSPVNETDHV